MKMLVCCVWWDNSHCVFLGVVIWCLAVCIPGLWLHTGMSCNSSKTYSRFWAIPQRALSANIQRRHPPSVMGDNVISWLEYSLHEMRVSYSLTHVIIFWLIVSIERPTFILPPLLPFFKPLLIVISPPPSLFPFPLFPSFPAWILLLLSDSLSIPRHLVCAYPSCSL